MGLGRSSVGRNLWALLWEIVLRGGVFLQNDFTEQFGAMHSKLMKEPPRGCRTMTNLIVLGNVGELPPPCLTKPFCKAFTRPPKLVIV